ncbi:hypothetical protein D3C87_1205060 [compost metagenome]
MVRSSPRASAGFSKLAASAPPALLPAPINVWASSINSRIGVGDCCTASITCFSRCSNSPLTPAPACNSPRSSVSKLVLAMIAGTSPSAMRSASPSTSAVFPTPGSPTRMGLFLRRRARMSIICRISTSRPKTGSICPARALAVMSIVKRPSTGLSGRSATVGVSVGRGRISGSRCASLDTWSSSGISRSICAAETLSSGQASGARSQCGASTSAASRCAERISAPPGAPTAAVESDARIHAASSHWPTRGESPGRPRRSCGRRSIAASSACQMASTSSS